LENCLVSFKYFQIKKTKIYLFSRFYILTLQLFFQK
jgi:hypothetical protein